MQGYMTKRTVTLKCFNQKIFLKINLNQLVQVAVFLNMYRNGNNTSYGVITDINTPSQQYLIVINSSPQFHQQQNVLLLHPFHNSQCYQPPSSVIPVPILSTISSQQVNVPIYNTSTSMSNTNPLSIQQSQSISMHPTTNTNTNTDIKYVTLTKICKGQYICTFSTLKRIRVIRPDCNNRNDLAYMYTDTISVVSVIYKTLHQPCDIKHQLHIFLDDENQSQQKNTERVLIQYPVIIIASFLDLLHRPLL